MIATIFDTKTGASPVSIADLPQRLATGGFYWLDIDGASAEELRVAASALRLEEPTRSWLPRFGQRARFEMGAQQVRISTFTAGATGRPIEVHVLFTRSWLLTVRAGVGSVMDRAHGMYRTFGGEIASNSALGLLIVLDDFIASWFSGHPARPSFNSCRPCSSSCRHCTGFGSPSARRWRPSPSRRRVHLG
jgi:Mg2+ and Co2+ transporter CorA